MPPYISHIMINVHDKFNKIHNCQQCRFRELWIGKYMLKCVRTVNAVPFIVFHFINCILIVTNCNKIHMFCSIYYNVLYLSIYMSINFECKFTYVCIWYLEGNWSLFHSIIKYKANSIVVLLERGYIRLLYLIINSKPNLY